MPRTPHMAAGKPTWGQLMGTLPGLGMGSLLHAAASSRQSALLDAALPCVPWVPEVRRAERLWRLL